MLTGDRKRSVQRMLRKLDSRIGAIRKAHPVYDHAPKSAQEEYSILMQEREHCMIQKQGG